MLHCAPRRVETSLTLSHTPSRLMSERRVYSPFRPPRLVPAGCGGVLWFWGERKQAAHVQLALHVGHFVSADNIIGGETVKPMEPHVIDSIIELYQSGVIVRDIAKAVSYSDHTIYAVLRDHRDICPPRRPPKPTREQYELLRRMWADGASMREMADATGLKRNAVRNVIERNREDFPRRRER